MLSAFSADVIYDHMWNEHDGIYDNNDNNNYNNNEQYYSGSDIDEY